MHFRPIATKLAGQQSAEAQSAPFSLLAGLCVKTPKSSEVFTLSSQNHLFDPATDRRSAVRLARARGCERKKAKKKSKGLKHHKNGLADNFVQIKGKQMP